MAKFFKVKISMKRMNLVLGLLLILTFSSIVFYINETPSIKRLPEKKNIMFNLNTSSYVNLTGRRICIDDGWDDVWPYNSYNYLETSDNMTWAELEASEDWCSGSGTIVDPYVIENIYLDCQNMGAGISIFLSSVPFIIRNSYIVNSGIGESKTGITLVHVRNGQITNNTFMYDYDAIWLQWSLNNLISNNTMIHNTTTYGIITAGKVIKVVSSNNNTISKNRSLDYYDGICVWESNYNLITENFIETNKFGHYPDTGLYLVDSNHSTVTYNMFAGDYAKYPNPYGESIINEQNCVGNTISNNFNTQMTGLSITSNLLQESNIDPCNSGSWFTLSNSNYNYIYGNRLYPGESPNPTIAGYNICFFVGFLAIIVVIGTYRIKTTKEPF